MKNVLFLLIFVVSISMTGQIKKMTCGACNNGWRECCYVSTGECFNAECGRDQIAEIATEKMDSKDQSVLVKETDGSFTYVKIKNLEQANQIINTYITKEGYVYESYASKGDKVMETYISPKKERIYLVSSPSK